MTNYMKLKVEAVAANESFVRSTIAAFATRLNPTLEEIADIKTAVSEAITNCIVHAYKKGGEINVLAYVDKKSITIEISDNGCGISNIEEAKQPFFSTAGDTDRSGMGFTVMETFMDMVKVISKVNEGTTVILRKDIGIDG